MKHLKDLLLRVIRIVGCSDNNRKQDKPREILGDDGRILPEKDSTITTSLAKTFSYSHRTHGSVGYDYSVEYEEIAFHLESKVEYDKPKEVEAGMNGADSAVKTCVFKPLKKGRFTINIIHYYRGSIKNVITFIIIVK